MSKILPQEKIPPLLWALPDDLAQSDTAELISQLCGAGGKRKAGRDEMIAGQIEPWLAEAEGCECTVGYALECLAWCHALPALSGHISGSLWWELLGHLLSTCQDAAGIPLESDPLAHQLLSGELPLTLAYLFPEIPPCSKLAMPARRALSLGPVELLDGEGLLHCRNLPLLRPLLACWTRAGLLGRHLKGGCFRNDARNQYEWLVRQSLRLARYDGSQVFSSGSAGSWCKELFDAALVLSDDKIDNKIANLALPGRKSTRQTIRESALPSPALDSEWAETSVLRSAWSRGRERLTVTYANRNIVTELECGRNLLWSGNWNPDVRVNGKNLVPTCDWEEVCWHSDEDVDYLELEISLGCGWRIQRHILMAREDRFLFLADSLLGEEPGRIEYRCCLPLHEDIGFAAVKQSREGYLVGKRRLCSVFPLALPEWRNDPRHGTLTMTEQGLELAQTAYRSRMIAPLFIDLDSRRLARPFTWRQLTIAQEIQIQSLDVAAGYRVQIGSRQWLIYRSLALTGNRTLLGHNLTAEFLVARFNHDGNVEPLLEIE